MAHLHVLPVDAVNNMCHSTASPLNALDFRHISFCLTADFFLKKQYDTKTILEKRNKQHYSGKKKDLFFSKVERSALVFIYFINIFILKYVS